LCFHYFAYLNNLSCETENKIKFQEGYTSTELDAKKDVVILLGNTGTGKSTLSKFLRRDPTLKIEKNSGRRWIFTDGENKIGSKSSQVSKTLYPNVDVDDETGVQVVDCAGFQDTRSPEFDLLAGFFNKKLLDSSGKVKIVLVENYFNVQQNGNRNSFTQALQQTANLIGANFNSFNGSFGLVATKVYNPDSDEDVLFEITAFLTETLQYLQKENATAAANGNENKAQDFLRQVRLLEFLLQGENVRLFRRPENFQLDSIVGNQQQLRQLVFGTLITSKPFTHTFQVTVSAETINFINEKMLKKSTDALEKEFQNMQDALLRNLRESTDVNLKTKHLRSKSIIQFCEDYLKILAVVDSLEQLIHFVKRRGVSGRDLPEIHFQVDKATFFHQVVGKDIDDIMNAAISEFKSSLATNVH
jgi:energy-coupling factor transporter ATP-binding protein EcfA2